MAQKKKYVAPETGQEVLLLREGCLQISTGEPWKDNELGDF